MSDFNGKILVIDKIEKEETLNTFLNNNFEKIRDLLYKDCGLDKQEEIDFTIGFLKHNHKLCETIILKNEDCPLIVLFLQNTAGCYETIHIFGYEYDYETKNYIKKKNNKIKLDNLIYSIYDEYFSLPR